MIDWTDLQQGEGSDETGGDTEVTGGDTIDIHIEKTDAEENSLLIDVLGTGDSSFSATVKDDVVEVSGSSGRAAGDSSVSWC